MIYAFFCMYISITYKGLLGDFYFSFYFLFCKQLYWSITCIVVLVSAVQQTESAIRIHISPYLLPLASPFHHPYPTHLGGHKAPSWSPCAMWLLPTSYLFYIWLCISVNALSHFVPAYPSPSPSPQVHSLHLHLYFCPAPRFSGIIFFFRFHVYVLAYGICFSLSDLLHSI